MYSSASELAAAAQRQSDLKNYKNEGFCIARGLLPRLQVEHVFSDMHKLVKQQLKHRSLPSCNTSSPSDMHHDLHCLFQCDLAAYIATLTICGKLVSLFDLYLHHNVRTFAAELGINFPVFQTTPVVHLMANDLNIPNGYHGVGAHQDWPTLQGSLDTVTIWIPFVPVDANLFTLEIIPESHKHGLLPYTRQANIFEVDSNCYDPAKFLAIEAEPGDVVFMSTFAIHRSSTTGDDRLRLATSMRYENAGEPHFIARTYPFAQKRSVLAELITPGFPSVADFG